MSKMANRTVQFLGQGYADGASEPITITATLGGNTVFSGTIPTLYTSNVSRTPGDQVVLFTCELPIEYTGTTPMSIDLDSPVGVDVFFEQILSNYMPVTSNIAGNVTTVSSGPDTFILVNGQDDPRSNVVINGILMTRGEDPPGTWGWEVDFLAEESGTFTYDLTVQPGLE